MDSSTTKKTIFYDNDYRNVIQDSCERGILSVSLFHRLSEYSDPNFAKHNAYWVENGSEAILCERTAGPNTRQLILETTALLWSCNFMPFMDEDKLRQATQFSGPGHQWAVLAGVGQDVHENSCQAIEVIHDLASYRRPIGALKDLPNIVMDGEHVICASLPVCTTMNQLQEDSELVSLQTTEDPHGIVSQFARTRDAVVTTDNLVRFTLAEHLKHADRFKFHDCSGALFHPGQVVKAELGFRIIMEEELYVMRIDLMGISIINEDITQAIAFSNRQEKTRIVQPSLHPPIHDRPKVLRYCR